MKKLFLVLLLTGVCFGSETVHILNRAGDVTTPGVIRPDDRWPVIHLNVGSAAKTQLLEAPGNTRSYYITGFILSGGATGDGFSFMRQDCLEFGGINNTWTVSDNALLQFDDGDYSIELWYRNDLVTPTQTILVKDDGDDGYTLATLSDGTIRFTHQDGSATVTVTTSTSTTTSEAWQFVTVTCDRDSATGLNIYIDGELEDTNDVSSATGQCDGTSQDLVSTGTDQGNVYMSALGIYKGTTLSAATVLSNYNSGIGRKYEGDETNLSVAWNNDEGSGTTCYNTSLIVPATLSNTIFAPYKQYDSTAEVNIGGVPFDTRNMMTAVGKFHCGYQIGTAGGFSGMAITFPHAIKLGRNCPLSVLETDGDWSLIVFGFEDLLRE